MWTLLVLLLVVPGVLALCDAPARARRHARERDAVMRALAGLPAGASASAVGREIVRHIGRPLPGRAIRAQLTALEEDGMVEAKPTAPRPGAEPAYRLLAEPPEPESPATACASRVTVYHDGGCPLCAVEIGHYRRAQGAGAVAFVDVADPTAAPAGDLTREAALARFHVRDEGGALVSGAAAFAALWRTLPNWRWLGHLVGTWPILPLAELAYRAFLPLRPLIARTLVRFGVLESRSSP